MPRKSLFCAVVVVRGSASAFREQVCAVVGGPQSADEVIWVIPRATYAPGATYPREFLVDYALRSRELPRSHEHLRKTEAMRENAAKLDAFLTAYALEG